MVKKVVTGKTYGPRIKCKSTVQRPEEVIVKESERKRKYWNCENFSWSDNQTETQTDYTRVLI